VKCKSWNNKEDKKQTSIPSVEFEPTIPAIKRLQIYSLDCTATRIGLSHSIFIVNLVQLST